MLHPQGLWFMFTTAAAAILNFESKGVIDGVFDLVKRQASSIRANINPLDAFDELEVLGDIQVPVSEPAPSIENFSNDDFPNVCPNFQQAVDAEGRGVELTEGIQKIDGSFSNTVHGDITGEEVVVKFVDPPQLSVFDIGVPITFTAQAINYSTSVFLDARVSYYRDPQATIQGFPIGHIHFSCERVDGSVQVTNRPEGSAFDFFQGINAGTPDSLQGTNPAGFQDPGLYRCCIMPAGHGHQCLVFPRLDRKPEMDCVMYIVRDGGLAGEPDDLESAGLNNLAQPRQ